MGMMWCRNLVFALVLLFSMSSVAGAACLSPPGNLNGDGVADVVDVQCAILVTLYELGAGDGASPFCLSVTPVEADINCEGGVNVTDVLLVTQHALSLSLSPLIDSNQDGCVDECGSNGDPCANAAVVCDDGKQCTNDSCDPATGCVHETIYNQPCDDGDLCTEGDVCVSDFCVAGIVVDCSSEVPCVQGTCDSEEGCVTENVTGDFCQDGDACTEGDVCLNGTCLPGVVVTCDDQNPCTVDTCFPEQGCVFDASICPEDLDGDGVVNEADCSPLDASIYPGAPEVCNGVNDDCDAETDEGGDVLCDDGNVCTVTVCAGTQGCIQSSQDGSSCDDGNPCTSGDSCVGGACQPQALTDCSDGDPCTLDQCHPSSGCVSSQQAGPGCVVDCLAGITHLSGESIAGVGHFAAIAVQGGVGYAVTTTGLELYDLSNPAAPVPLSSLGLPGISVDVKVSGNYAYVSDNYAGLYVVDVSDVTSPFIAHHVDSIALARASYLDGNNLYVMDGAGALYILDVTVPESPSILSATPISPGEFGGVVVANGMAYVGNEAAGLRIFNVTNPMAPVQVAQQAVLGNAVGVDYHPMGLVFVATQATGISVVNVANPMSPQVVGGADTPGFAQSVKLQGNYAYVADYFGGVQIFELTLSMALNLVGTAESPGLAMNTAMIGQNLLISDWTAGLRVVDVSSPSSPQEVGFYKSDLGGNQGLDAVGDYVFIADGFAGMRVVDVQDPTAPENIATLTVEGFARMVKVQDGIAYVAMEFGGVQMWDVSNPGQGEVSYPYLGGFLTPGWAMAVLPHGDKLYVGDYDKGLRIYQLNPGQAPTFISYVDTPGLVYGLDIQGDVIYAADWSHGLQAIDVSDSANPQVVGGIVPPTVTARGVEVYGSFAYLSDISNGVRIIDISDPANLVEAGVIETQEGVRRTVVESGVAYIGEEMLGLLLVDVTNPYSPKILGGYDTFGITHGIAVKGSKVYLADRGSVLQVVDVQLPCNDGDACTYDFCTPQMGCGFVDGSTLDPLVCSP